MAAIEKLLTIGLCHGTDFERILKSVPGSTTPTSERITWEDVMGAVGFVKDKGRFSLVFVAAPLRVVGGTGSPVNPIAVF